MTALPLAALSRASNQRLPKRLAGHRRLAGAGSSTEQESTMEAGDTQIMIAGNLGDDPELRFR